MGKIIQKGRFVYILDEKTKKASSLVELVDILKTGYYNVILIIDKGRFVSNVEVLKENLKYKQALKFAKEYLRVH